MSPKTLEKKKAMQTATIDLDQVVSRNPEIMSGSLCFKGTRVNVSTLYDYVNGDPENGLEDFLIGFPTVTREQAETVLQFKREDLNI